MTPFKNRLPDAMNCSPKVNFTQVPNEMLEDENISHKAVGILCRLLVNKEGWVSYYEKLTKPGIDGKDSVSSGIAELIRHGYFRKMVFKDKQTNKIRGSFIAYTATANTFDFSQHFQFASQNNLVISNHPRSILPITQKTDRSLSDAHNTEKPYMANPPLIILKDKANALLDNNTKTLTEVNVEPTEVGPASTIQISRKRKLLTLPANKPEPPPPEKPLRQSQRGQPIVIPHEPKPHTVSVPKPVQEVLDAWNASGLRRHTNEKSSVYRQAVTCIKKLMKGKMFERGSFTKQNRPFSKLEIISAIKNFSLATLNPQYEPSNPKIKEALKGFSLPDFIYNVRQDSSNFLKCLNPPALCTEAAPTIAEADPMLTQRMITEFEELTGQRVNGNKNSLIAGANMLHKFYERKYEHNCVSMSGHNNKYALPKHLIKSIMEHFNGRVSVGNLSSKYTYKEIFPKYLTEHGIWSVGEGEDYNQPAVLSYSIYEREETYAAENEQLMSEGATDFD